MWVNDEPTQAMRARCDATAIKEVLGAPRGAINVLWLVFGRQRRGQGLCLLVLNVHGAQEASRHWKRKGRGLKGRAPALDLR